MHNNDLRKIRESKEVLFGGIKKILLELDLGHLDIAGLELEPSSVTLDEGHGHDKNDDQTDFLPEALRCPGGRAVLRVDPVTGRSYWICVNVG